MALLAIPPSFDGYNMLLLLFFLVGAVLLLGQLFEPRMDPREPRLLRPAIPLVGHLLGIIQNKMEYYAIVSRKSPYPDFTMPVLSSKIYVITSPLLAQAALRHKNLDFTTIITGIALRPFEITQENRGKIRKDSMDRNKVSYISEVHKLTYENLGPGPSLDAMNTKMLSKVAMTLNTIGFNLELEQLWPWLRETFTLATTYSLYGQYDPFSADPSLYHALRDFDDQVGILLLGILPFITARKGYKGRIAIQKAFETYFNAGHDEDSDASGLIRARGIMHRKYGFSAYESSETELSTPWVSTVNAIPALYWMLCYVVSDTQLLRDLRNEVLRACTAIREGASQTFTFSVARFNSEDCPLLLSTYQETLRLTNFQISIRMVEEDTVLSAGNESILVKKGNVVQIPAGVTHTSTAIWGTDSDSFRPRRFMKQGDEDKEQGKARKSAYIPFGGGKHLCPGRYFAQAEILGMIAAVITGFEVMDKDGGPVPPPRADQVSRDFGQAMGKPTGPAQKMGVQLIRREGMEHVKFAFSI